MDNQPMGDIERHHQVERNHPLASIPETEKENQMTPFSNENSSKVGDGTNSRTPKNGLSKSSSGLANYNTQGAHRSAKTQ